MICAYMLHRGLYRTAEEAHQHYASARTMNGKVGCGRGGASVADDGRGESVMQPVEDFSVQSWGPLVRWLFTQFITRGP